MDSRPAAVLAERPDSGETPSALATSSGAKAYQRGSAPPRVPTPPAWRAAVRLSPLTDPSTMPGGSDRHDECASPDRDGAGAATLVCFHPFAASACPDV